MTEEKRELPETASILWLPVMRKLHAARRKLGAVTKDANNTFFKSKYATLSAVLDAVDPICEELNLEYWQWLAASTSREEEAGVCIMVTRLVDIETGSYLDSFCSAKPAKDRDPQALGSLITYLRRYGLVLAFGVRVEDDDGNGASGRGEANSKASGGVAGLRSKVAAAPKKPPTVKVPLNPEAVAAAVDAGFPFDLEEWCKELEACKSLDELDLVLGMPKKAGIELAEEDKRHAAAVYRRCKTQLEDAIPL